MTRDHSMPETVGDLAGFDVEIRCKRCGRIAAIAPAQMASEGGRAVDRRMPLPKFLARLKCTVRACGERPVQLHLSAPAPGGPGAGPGATHPPTVHHWVMDLRGRWSYLGADNADGGDAA